MKDSYPPQHIIPETPFNFQPESYLLARISWPQSFGLSPRLAPLSKPSHPDMLSFLSQSKPLQLSWPVVASGLYPISLRPLQRILLASRPYLVRSAVAPPFFQIRKVFLGENLALSPRTYVVYLTPFCDCSLDAKPKPMCEKQTPHPVRQIMYWIHFIYIPTSILFVLISNKASWIYQTIRRTCPLSATPVLQDKGDLHIKSFLSPKDKFLFSSYPEAPPDW